MAETISILGCGWLGFPLGIALVKAGYAVKGSSTTSEKLKVLKANGISPYLIAFDPLGRGENQEEFFLADILIINIPLSAGKKPLHYHPNQIMNIRDQALKHDVRKCIYVSTTSVYPDLNGEVTENSPTELSSKSAFAALTAEKIISHPALKTTILRCGGLMGYDRNPAKYLAYLTDPGYPVDYRRRPRKAPDTPVNYIHRDDAVGIIRGIIEQEAWNEIFNAVAPHHPTRAEIALRQSSGPEIQYEGVWDKSYKVAVSEKVIKQINYTFKYPDPLWFYYD